MKNIFKFQTYSAQTDYQIGGNGETIKNCIYNFKNV